MSQENQITLRGYLTAEPKFYQRSPQAVPLAEIRMGCTPRRLNRETGEWQDLPTSYYRVKAWRRLAINCVSSLHKGDMVIVRGHFYMSSWVDNQQRPRSTLEIEAETIGHDLAYGWSHYMRGNRPSGNRADVNAGEMARQDTGAPGSGDGGHIPDLEAAGLDVPGGLDAPGGLDMTEPDEQADAAPRPGEQSQPWAKTEPEAGAGQDAWRPGVNGDAPADARAGWDETDALVTDGSGDREAEAAAEPEAVPF